MLKRIEIECLFGRFDYAFDLKTDGITIITGPNGFGKSTLLKLINAISMGNYSYINEMEFSNLVIYNNDDEKIVIRKELNKLFVNNIEVPTFFMHREMYYQLSRLENHIVDKELDFEALENLLLDTRYFTTRHYRRELDNDLMDSLSLIHRIESKGKDTSFQELWKEIKRVKNWCGKVRIITDKRLYYNNDKKNESSDNAKEIINELPDDLKEKIGDISEKYSRISNKLDSTYPQRLFKTKGGITEEEYETQLNSARDKYEKLSRYGLVDRAMFEEVQFDSKYATALKIYFDDFSEKYDVFKEFIGKLDLFSEIINNRLSFKKIEISAEKGFFVVDEDDANKEIPLEKLSSGEKQEIFLFYDLIFNTEQDVLLLIDEPEISLHIAWQQMFMDDLLKVSRLTNLKAIVATHSPHIINNHWNLQVDLGEFYGK